MAKKKFAAPLTSIARVDTLNHGDRAAPPDKRHCVPVSVPREELHPAWHDGIARRVANMDAGQVRFMPADAAMAALAAYIRRRQPIRR